MNVCNAILDSQFCTGSVRLIAVVELALLAVAGLFLVCSDMCPDQEATDMPLAGKKLDLILRGYAYEARIASVLKQDDWLLDIFICLPSVMKAFMPTERRKPLTQLTLPGLTNCKWLSLVGGDAQALSEW